MVQVVGVVLVVMTFIITEISMQKIDLQFNRTGCVFPSPQNFCEGCFLFCFSIFSFSLFFYGSGGGGGGRGWWRTRCRQRYDDKIFAMVIGVIEIIAMSELFSIVIDYDECSE